MTRPENIVAYIHDQSVNPENLPPNACPGYSAFLFDTLKKKELEGYSSGWCRTESDAQRMASELLLGYQIEYIWNKRRK